MHNNSKQQSALLLLDFAPRVLADGLATSRQPNGLGLPAKVFKCKLEWQRQRQERRIHDFAPWLP